ncbi:sulfate transporter CysZ [Oceanospirillum linum]|uniref:Sulfate transporter CysZ n=1 Tax=Oceanospirillum linum TaxID=966 RepID=A0A1T1HC78_OCELI|nr:sulfate transporter CysZ [Oceanospirillum linum]OOV87340.1 sulfate transporter CysZ [Oceanospirillum linum]
MIHLFSGPASLAAGFRLITMPGMKRFVLVPLLSNIIILSVFIWLTLGLIDGWLDSLIAFLPEWLSFLGWLLWPLALIAMLGFVLYGFNATTALIAAPFNGLLAEKIELKLRNGQVDFPDETIAEMAKRSLHRELQKQWFFLKRVVLLLIISFIPVVNLISPVLWFMFSVWMLSIQYMDYPMDNHKVDFHAMQRRLKQNWWHTVSFGLVCYLLMFIPFINLIFMPAAVAGATWLWVRQLSVYPDANLSSVSLNAPSGMKDI